MIPIEASTEKMCWQIEKAHLQKVEQFALKERVSLKWINTEILVWNVGHRNELILTPEGFYTQSAYNGSIDKVVLEDIQRIASELTAKLKQEGGYASKTR